MNYNNKHKPLQAKPSENMMMSDHSKLKLPSGRSSLYSVLLVGLLAGAAPLSVMADNSKNTAATNQAAGTTNQAAGATNQAAGATNQAAGATNQAAGATNQAAGATNQAADSAKPATGGLPWKNIVFAVLGLLLLIIFYTALRSSVSKQLDEKINELKQRSDQNTKRLVSESEKKQAEHLKHAFADIEQLKQQVQQLRQLQQQPALSGGRQREADLDFPTLQPVAPIIPPQRGIEKEDLMELQEAFLEWRSNSRAKKLLDCLSSGFLQKIKVLGYEIVFAKAGIGLNKMIIDRKPPNNTCMIGLSKPHHSLMFCYDKTSQTDDKWRPSTWNEVSIDVPDSAGEQTIHKLKELSA